MHFDESMASTATTSRTCASACQHIDLTELVIEHDGGGIPFCKDIADKFKSGAYRRDLPDEIVKAMVVPAERATSRAPSSTSSRSS